MAGQRAVISAAVMMVLFFQAARLAMVAFDPYMSSRPLAQALESSPAGTLIVDRHYYKFSSVFFYTNRTALLLNGRYQNLEYGAYAPGAPPVFVDDSQFSQLWHQSERYYVVAYESELPRFERLAGDAGVVMVRRSGGKMLFTNHPLGTTAAAGDSKRHECVARAVNTGNYLAIRRAGYFRNSRRNDEDRGAWRRRLLRVGHCALSFRKGTLNRDCR